MFKSIYICAAVIFAISDIDVLYNKMQLNQEDQEGRGIKITCGLFVKLYDPLSFLDHNFQITQKAHNVNLYQSYILTSIFSNSTLNYLMLKDDVILNILSKIINAILESDINDINILLEKWNLIKLNIDNQQYANVINIIDQEINKIVHNKDFKDTTNIQKKLLQSILSNYHELPLEKQKEFENMEINISINDNMPLLNNASNYNQTYATQPLEDLMKSTFKEIDFKKITQKYVKEDKINSIVELLKNVVTLIDLFGISMLFNPHLYKYTENILESIPTTTKDQKQKEQEKQKRKQFMQLFQPPKEIVDNCYSNSQYNNDPSYNFLWCLKLLPDMVVQGIYAQVLKDIEEYEKKAKEKAKEKATKDTSSIDEILKNIPVITNILQTYEEKNKNYNATTIDKIRFVLFVLCNYQDTNIFRQSNRNGDFIFNFKDIKYTFTNARYMVINGALGTISCLIKKYITKSDKPENAKNDKPEEDLTDLQSLFNIFTKILNEDNQKKIFDLFQQIAHIPAKEFYMLFQLLSPEIDHIAILDIVDGVYLPHIIKVIYDVINFVLHIIFLQVLNIKDCNKDKNICNYFKQIVQRLKDISNFKEAEQNDDYILKLLKRCIDLFKGYITGMLGEQILIEIDHIQEVLFIFIVSICGILPYLFLIGVEMISKFNKVRQLQFQNTFMVFSTHCIKELTQLLILIVDNMSHIFFYLQEQFLKIICTLLMKNNQIYINIDKLEELNEIFSKDSDIKNQCMNVVSYISISLASFVYGKNKENIKGYDSKELIQKIIKNIIEYLKELQDGINIKPSKIPNENIGFLEKCFKFIYEILNRLCENIIDSVKQLSNNEKKITDLINKYTNILQEKKEEGSQDNIFILIVMFIKELLQDHPITKAIIAALCNLFDDSADKKRDEKEMEKMTNQICVSLVSAGGLLNKVYASYNTIQSELSNLAGQKIQLNSDIPISNNSYFSIYSICTQLQLFGAITKLQSLFKEKNEKISKIGMEYFCDLLNPSSSLQNTNKKYVIKLLQHLITIDNNIAPNINIWEIAEKINNIDCNSILFSFKAMYTNLSTKISIEDPLTPVIFMYLKPLSQFLLDYKSDNITEIKKIFEATLLQEKNCIKQCINIIDFAFQILNQDLNNSSKQHNYLKDHMIEICKKFQNFDIFKGKPENLTQFFQSDNILNHINNNEYDKIIAQLKNIQKHEYKIYLTMDKNELSGILNTFLHTFSKDTESALAKKQTENVLTGAMILFVPLLLLGVYKIISIVEPNNDQKTDKKRERKQPKTQQKKQKQKEDAAGLFSSDNIDPSLNIIVETNQT